MTAGPRIALIGDGKMSRAIRLLAAERGVEVTSVLGSAGNPGGAGISRQALGGADVAVEFTEPAAAPANIRACLRAGVPVVVGTTGWHGELPAIAEEVRASGGALLWASNFSVGVNLFFRIAGEAGRIVARAEGFDAHIVETHHAAKKDAPSGTALAVERELRAGLGRPVPITSIRTGHVPGTHEIVLDAPFEQIVIAHAARDRRVFADGALLAARWLVAAPRQGVFTMSDVLGGGQRSP
jgi:4-hydroxy-tetrahydrodipicolinate reductase